MVGCTPFIDTVMNQRVHNKPINFTEEAAGVSFFLGDYDVAVIVYDVARQVARTARPPALDSAGALYNFRERSNGKRNDG